MRARAVQNLNALKLHMASTMKKIVDFARPLILLVLRLFFQGKYLTGRHFDQGYSGIAYAVKAIWVRNILRLARPCPFPVALGCTISRPDRLRFHPDDLNNFQAQGSYFQNLGADITIGRGTYIAPNVGLITTNHDPFELGNHTSGSEIVIGENCWIGMNAVVLPGVILGARTIVGAGSVVTKSFVQGHCIVAGIPAKIIRELQ
jgi:hypothetical protein